MSKQVIKAPVRAASELVAISKLPQEIKKARIARIHVWDKESSGGVILYGIAPEGALAITLDEAAIKAGIFTKVHGGYVHAFGPTFTKKEGKTLDTIIL